jgi:hypothetical protein
MGIDGEESARRRRRLHGEGEGDGRCCEHNARIAEIGRCDGRRDPFLANPHGSLTLVLGRTGTLRAKPRRKET